MRIPAIVRNSYLIIAGGLFLVWVGLIVHPSPVVGEQLSHGQWVLVHPAWVGFIMVCIVGAVLTRHIRLRIVSELFLGAAQFVGIACYLTQYTSFDGALVVAGVGIAVRVLYPLVWVHNIGVMMGVGGVVRVLGEIIPFGAIAAILVALAVFDIIAGYERHHIMEREFDIFFKKHIPFGLIVGEEEVGWRTLLSGSAVWNNAWFMGSGDLLFPLLGVIGVYYQWGVGGALCASGGLLVGTVGVDMWALYRAKGVELPALPGLVAGLMLGGFLGLVLWG